MSSLSRFKNISNTRFRRSRYLKKRYGLYSDSDHDGKINKYDCYPFDKDKQDVAVTPSKIIGKVGSQIIKKQQENAAKSNKSGGHGHKKTELKILDAKGNVTGNVTVDNRTVSERNEDKDKEQSKTSQPQMQSQNKPTALATEQQNSYENNFFIDPSVRIINKNQDQTSGTVKPTSISTLSQWRGSSYSSGYGIGNKARKLAAGAAAGTVDLVRSDIAFIKDPVGTLLYTFNKIRGEGFPEIGKMIRNEPEFATGYLGSQIAIGEAQGAAVKTGGSYALEKGAAVKTRLSPGYVPVEEGALAIKTSKGIKNVELIQSWKQGAMGAAEQIKLSGQKVTAVSAQRDLFGKIFGKTKSINKPAPEGVSPIHENIERSFFADPNAKLRTGRLELAKPTSSGFKFPDIKSAGSKIIDYLSEKAAADVEFIPKIKKDQALIFPETEVESLPNNLRPVGKKIQAGKEITYSEFKQFEQWQMTPSGKFKPIGKFTQTGTGFKPTREAELTLAPGEVLKKDKTLGATIINGKRVEIIEPAIGQMSPSSKRLLKAYEGGTISKETFSKAISKETGLDYGLSPKKSSLPIYAYSPKDSSDISYARDTVTSSRPSSRPVSSRPSTIIYYNPSKIDTSPVYYGGTTKRKSSSKKVTYPKPPKPSYPEYPEERKIKKIEYTNRYPDEHYPKISTSGKITYIPPTIKTPRLKPNKIEVWLKDKPGKYNILRPQPKRYTPSLIASTFNIRGKAPKRLTGIEFRPIPINRPGKKRAAKKTKRQKQRTNRRR